MKIQIVKPGGYWTYILEGKKYYLPNLGFVVLLNDFGFSLIPNKLYLTWYHKKLSSSLLNRPSLQIYCLCILIFRFCL